MPQNQRVILSRDKVPIGMLIGSRLEIPEGVTEIADHCFCDLMSLEELVIPSSVVRIGNGAFENCVNLKKVTFHKCDHRSGGSRVFKGCTQLKEVHADSLDTVLNYVHDNYSSPFQYCAKLFIDGQELTAITVPDDLDRLSKMHTLVGCSSIRNIYISESHPLFEEFFIGFEDFCTKEENYRYYTAHGWDPDDICFHSTEEAAAPNQEGTI